MCGICGIVTADDPGAGEAVRAMMDVMRHRGPDDEGLWTDAGTGLGARRLSVQDIAGGHQPIASEDGSVVVVFNGEVYNFEDLRADLEKRGHVFRTRTDTEVIVHAYEEHGDRALDLFNGMFALALYDRGARRLLLARDRLGIKPLFYAHRNGKLLFASELDALLRSGRIDATLDPGALGAYFTYLYIPAPDTVFREVRKLRPGEKLVWEKGKVRTERYWRPRFAIDPEWTLEDASRRFVELLADSVRLRKISDVPLGAFLSGGIDSSTVAGLLSFMSGQPIKTFSIGFDDAHANELRHARQAARLFATDHREDMVTPDMVEVVGDLTRHFGEPFADSSAVPTWLVSRLARQDVTVALSGDGGDELFAGYAWTRMNRRVARYRRVPANVRRALDLAFQLLPATPTAGKLRRFSRDSFLDPVESLRRRETCFLPDQRRAMLPAPDEGADRFLEHAADAARLSRDDRMLYQDLVMYLPDDILTKVDRASMAVSLEVRVPFLDHRLVEFAATVPFDLKLKGNTSKRLVKHAVKDLLPPELLRRRKQGFAIPIQRWFREDLRDHFRETVLVPGAACEGLLRREAVEALFARHVERRENLGHHLWAVLVLERWLRYARSLPRVSL